jgi:hypothetical protein
MSQLAHGPTNLLLNSYRAKQLEHVADLSPPYTIEAKNAKNVEIHFNNPPTVIMP